MGIGAAIHAYRFINKSRKQVAKEKEALRSMRGDGGSVQTGVNARNAILEMQQRGEMMKNVANGQKSRNWELLKKKITSAKITEALTILKYEVNGIRVTVLRPLGEGGYSQVYEVYDKEKKMFALKVVDLSLQSEKMKNDLIR